MSNIVAFHAALVARILDGAGESTHAQRRAAFDDAELTPSVHRLVHKVALHPHAVTDDDVANAIASGLTEDQVFELVVCAAVGQATRQLEAGRAALEIATREV